MALWLDNQYIRSLPLYYRKWAPPFFHYHIKREVIARFPQSSQLSISTMEGKHLRFRKSSAAKVEVPHGDSTIFDYLSSASGIDKKGFLSLAPDTIEARQQRYLKIYARAQKYFSQSFGSPLFLMYGTLLGHIREGDFIQSDDDFDAGYLSHKRTAADVKRETMHLVVDLVLAGFTCSFNRNGRLFRLRLKDDKPDVHLDVRPVWYENGYIWAHKQACLPLEISDFEPVRTEILRGVEVDVPKNAERVLAAYYGEGWKVPDPSYSNASQKVPRFVTRKLKSVCITPADYQEMQAQIDARRPDYPEAGKLIATGLYPLYPLEDYEANCEW
ncbi:LicD family protein [Alkalispirillum mobile]|uniref:LicD family protein n=1 Tax=Alkalispirillum mobile TaxID=85925 RepID=UPI001FE448E8|nr:LicD family protein [Alkalispirillum mobile]